ncbi:hypothetical protein B0H12DRAFT_1232209 [Mycena haematopus]|nr:hypothetical protein B0H12DRAFT_1232209 [Mycena haematopus]
MAEAGIDVVPHMASSRAFPLSDTLSTLSSASRLLSLPLLNLLDLALTPKPSVSDLGWASSKSFSCSATRTQCSSPSSFLGVDVAQTPSRSAVNHFLPAANTAVVLGGVSFFRALAIRLGARVLARAQLSGTTSLRNPPHNPPHNPFGFGGHLSARYSTRRLCSWPAPPTGGLGARDDHPVPNYLARQACATLRTTLRATLRVTHSDSVGKVSQAPAVRHCPACTLRRPSAPAAMLVDLDIAALITAVPLDVVATTLTKALQNMQGPHYFFLYHCTLRISANTFVNASFCSKSLDLAAIRPSSTSFLYA